ncbi:hypothetical protein RGQ29_018371 [Quercus rubra]|uniref:Uncharacterized protein n=1 Tax=Quercus rubra TaxID=3512 RepID=A0AAN7IUH0_QUERU|nr:hypothetical protein RGQ29_018371 [Quercus rubra]
MVIVPTSYFFTVRLMRKERKGTIAAELLSDFTLADYSKKKKKNFQSQCVPYGFISSTYAKELKKNRDCSGRGMLLRVLKQLHTIGF